MMRKLAFLVAAVGLASVPVSAQVFDMGGLTGTLSVDHVTQSERARAGRATAAKSFRSQLSSPARSGPMVASLPYSPSPAVRAKVVNLFLENGPKNPAYVSDIKQFVGSGRVFREYAAIAQQVGLRLNNAVDAYTFYMIAQWTVANDYRPMPTRAQVAGVRAQASRALAGVAPALGTPAARQEFAETLIAQGAIMAGVHSYAESRGDQALIRRLASQARRGGVAVFNMDPTRIALTNSGFRLRGSADAGGAGTGTEALASADVSSADAEGKSDADGGAAQVAAAAVLISGLGLWAWNGKRRRLTEAPASKL